MYGYNPQGNHYPSSYTTNPSTAAVVNAYGSVTQPSAQQQTGMFGDFGSSATNPYPSYQSSVAAASAYPTYGTQGSVSSQQQAAYAAQASRLNDAYAVAAAQQSVAGLGALGFGSLTPASTNSYTSALRGNNSTSSQNTYMNMRSGGGASHNTSMSHMSSSTRANSSSGYSGYDAAVYAAASSYLQSKATGQSNMWMSKKTSQTPKGTFPNKRYGVGASTGQHRDVQQFYCEVCKISCAGQLTYKEHLEGQRHKKKEALSKGENSAALPKSKVSFRCDLCNVTCTGQDTYQAHVRGAKHQKTLNLCKKLGKPIPANEPTIIPPAELGGTMPPPPGQNNPIPTVGGGSVQNKKNLQVLGLAPVNFVGGSKLSTTAVNDAKKAAVAAAVGSAGVLVGNFDKETSEQVEALIAAEQSVQPVGEEYVEAQRDGTGKLITYNCKLCDCKFSDPNAKDIHLKGRRHRLQYKMKVNPNLEVDVKPQQRGRIRGMPLLQRAGTGPYDYSRPMSAVGGYARPWFGNGERRFESSDDKHVQAKHTAIYPDDSELEDVERLVTMIEKSLKNVSDFFAERDVLSEQSNVKQEVMESEDSKPEPDRLLKGVMRVGLLAKGLLLKGDSEVELVVLCSKIPSVKLLNEVAELLPTKSESCEKFSVRLDMSEAAFHVSIDSVPFSCKVTLTSRLLREEAGDSNGGKGNVPEDALSETKCLEALAQLRHAKWFQARCGYLQSCQITLRILRDVRKRISSWSPLSSWMCELLVEKVLASCGAPLSIGDALRRVFEAISSGILFESGPGLLDPCEKDRIDVLSSLTGQQREDITSSAQHALRLIAFNQLYTILDISRLPESRVILNGDRKRPAGSNEITDDDIKKDKKDENVMKMEV